MIEKTAIVRRTAAVALAGIAAVLLFGAQARPGNAAGAVPSPSPSPSASPISSIGTVRVVTGTAATLHALPITAAAITSQTISASNSSLDSALRALPGFDRTRANGTFSNYGLDRLSIGGAGNDRAGLLVDGFPGLDPFGGQVDWQALPAPAITRAEILLGPGSALYGSGAIGGALDIRTFSAADVGTKAFAAPTYTYGGISEEGTVLVGIPAGNWKFAAWGDTSRGKFGALAPANSYRGSYAATTVAGTARATAHYAQGPLTLDLGALAGTDAQNEGRPNYTFSRNMNQADVALGYTRGDTTATFRTYDRDFNLINTSDTFPSAPGKLLYNQYVPSSESGYSLDLAQVTPGNQLLLRGETRTARGSSTQYSALNVIQNAGGGTERTNGYVIEDDATLGHVHLLAGGRLDNILTNASIAGASAIGRTDSAISPRLAVSWVFVPAVSVRVYGGTGLRTPFLNELVRAYRIGTIAYNPNLGLLPERSRSGGVGLDYAQGRTHATIDWQSTSVVNAIAFRTISPTVQMRSNVGGTRTDGAQVSVQHLMPCGSIDFSAANHYARVTSDVDKFLIGERLAYVPNYNVGVGYTGGGPLVGTVRVTFVGPAYADDKNTQYLRQAAVVDASLSQQTKWGALTLGLSNATNDVFLSSPDRLSPPANIWFRISTRRPGQSAPHCS